MARKACRDTITYHMAASVTVRYLRNRFPKVRKMVETDGEVLLTDRGKTRYRLTLYTQAAPAKEPPRNDYVARMKRHQPCSMSRAAAKALDQAHRGER